MTTFRPELVEKIFNRKKSQTRRSVVPGDVLKTEPLRVYRETKRATLRLHWQVGKSYAIQPGRGKPGVGHVTVTNIRFEDVRMISLDDAKAEGFETVVEFLAVWVGFYDKHIQLAHVDHDRWHLIFNGDLTVNGIVSAEAALGFLKEHRPARLYEGWALTFELVDEQAEVAVAS
jgi:hypothetical protein